MVKSLPAVWETRVQSLGWENSLGEGNDNPQQYSGCLNRQDAWSILWMEGPGRLQSMGSQRVRHDFTFKKYKPLKRLIKLNILKLKTL